jgi:hypothetical protein
MNNLIINITNKTRIADIVEVVERSTYGTDYIEVVVFDNAKRRFYFDDLTNIIKITADILMYWNDVTN